MNGVASLQSLLDCSPEWRRVVRGRAGHAGTSHPVVVVPGVAGPRLEGESYHWETPGGRRILYPSAYDRACGRAVAVYVPSTLRVEVGAAWLLDRVRRRIRGRVKCRGERVGDALSAVVEAS